jgi:hypothetical protein
MTNVLSSLVLLVLSAVAFAQPIERWLLPDPDEIIKASQTLCADQAKSALLAWHYKKQGRTKEEVLALIPESPKALSLRVTSAMRENVEDVFTFPELSQYTYYSFRSEACMRETLGAVRMPRLATIYPSIAECQSLHGPEKSTSLSRCIQLQVRSVEPK